MKNQNPALNPTEPSQTHKRMPDDGIKVNGLSQVIEMLKHADPKFRASLLKRIQAKDPKTAEKLLRMFR